MGRAAKVAAAAGVALGCSALWLPTAGAATFSDSFAGRALVKGAPVEVTGSNVGAGREAGEPVPTALAAAGHSVWVEWEATQTGYFTFSTCASAISTVLGTYVGSEVSNLTAEESRAESDGPECSSVEDGITFLALNGANVQLQLDGDSFFVPPSPPPVTEGALALRIEATPPPPNDDFENATALAGSTTEEPGGARFYFADVHGYDWAAGKQTGEPNHAGDQGGASAWYTWEAPETGVARISLCCSAPDLLGVYTGTTLGGLSEVGSGKQSVEVPVTAGTTYRIAVDGEFSFFLGGPVEGSFNLTVGMSLASGATPPAPSVRSSPPLIAPATTIVKKTVHRGARSATFSFRSSEPGSSFRCRLDARKATPCDSPKRYAGLAPGSHTFKVFAVDAAGNADATPAIVRFSISRPR
jgi:hypothetical protein